MPSVQVHSEGVAILRCPLAGLLALFPGLLSLLLSLCHWVAVSPVLYLPTQRGGTNPIYFRNIPHHVEATRA